MPPDAAAETRWEQEAQFFDSVAERLAAELRPLHPATIRRYQKLAKAKLYAKEFAFSLMKPLEGKTILDLGCGDGDNACILARLGAQVTGIDVAPKSIELARRRAEINRVSASTRFICAPLESAVFPAQGFDVIWVDNVLHHVIPTLDETLARLRAWAKPGALMVFAEPMNLNPTLRKIRFLVPVHTEVTPGERPLEKSELAIIRRHVPDLQMRHFGFFGRFNRFVLPSYQYETAPLPRRLAADALTAADAVILRMGALKSLGSSAILYGHAR